MRRFHFLLAIPGFAGASFASGVKVDKKLTCAAIFLKADYPIHAFAVTDRSIKQLIDEGHDPADFELEQYAGKVVADLCTGNSPLVGILRKSDVEAFGVDLKTRACKWCYVADIRKMPFFKRSSVDEAFSTQGIFSYGVDPSFKEEAFEEVHRVLKTGARLRLAPVDPIEIEELSKGHGFGVIKIVDLNRHGYDVVSGAPRGISVTLKKLAKGEKPRPPQIITPNGGNSRYSLCKKFPAKCDMIRNPGRELHAHQGDLPKLLSDAQFLLTLENQHLKTEVLEALRNSDAFRVRDTKAFALVLKHFGKSEFEDIFVVFYAEDPVLSAIHGYNLNRNQLIKDLHPEPPIDADKSRRSQEAKDTIEKIYKKLANFVSH